MSKRSFHWSFFKDITRSHRGELLLIALCMGLSTGFTMLVPLWCKSFIDTVLPRRDMAHVGQHMILGILLALSIQVARYGRNFIKYRLGNRMCTEIRQLVFGKVLGFPFGTLNHYARGDLISRISIDVSVLQDGMISGIFVFVPNLLTAAGLMIIMFWHSFYLALLVLLVFPVVAVAINRFGRRIRTEARDAQKELARLNSLVEEAATGFKEIKSFSNEDLVRQRFREANDRTLEAYTKQDKLRALGPSTVSLIAFLGVGAMMLVSAWAVFRGISSTGDVTAFLTCLILSYSPIERMSEASNAISRMAGSFDRIADLLEAPQEKRAHETASAPRIVRGTIEFRNVGFSYPGGFQVRDLNFSIKAGETIAITGPNGSGKTTVLNLIPRFLESDSGSVLIDGLDIKEYSLESLRKEIGFVFQEAVLFDGSLMENLSFGKIQASREEILTAARAAHVDDFARELPDGYETHIGRYGNKLSAGQRQRISIARAFLKDPRILAMDEPTASLDTESDRLVNDSLSLLFKNRTTIIVTPRLSTIRSADRVIVMDKGRVAECVTYPELVKREGLYFIEP